MTQPSINSLQNQRIKDAIKLRNHRDRVRQGRFLIDGDRELEHALAGGVEIVEAFVCPEMCADPESAIRQLAEAGAEVSTVSAAVWDKLTFGQRRDGRLAVARPPAGDLSKIEVGENPLVVVLEAIEKPGNVGAVIRTADAAGATAVLVTEPVSDLYNPNTIRASLGTLFRMPVVACTNVAAQEWLSANAIVPFAAIVGAEVNYTAADFSQSCAIVMGSEAHGLSAAWRDAPTQGVSLPMYGFADSLNISTSAAVLMYEARRQKVQV